MRQHGATERAEHGEAEKNRRHQLAAAQEPAQQREEEIEHLLDRKRPENIPAAGKVSVPGLQKIHVKSECGDERAAEPSPIRRDNEVFDVREIEAAEDRQQQEEQRRDAGETQQVEIARDDTVELTPAAKRGRRDQKTGDGEEYLHAELPVPHERGYQLGGNRLRV